MAKHTHGKAADKQETRRQNSVCVARVWSSAARPQVLSFLNRCSISGLRFDVPSWGCTIGSNQWYWNFFFFFGRYEDCYLEVVRISNFASLFSFSLKKLLKSWWCHLTFVVVDSQQTCFLTPGEWWTVHHYSAVFKRNTSPTNKTEHTLQIAHSIYITNTPTLFSTVLDK